MQKKVFSNREYARIKQQYGDFRLDKNYGKQHIKGLSKESGMIRGVIVDIVKNVEDKIERILLPGEYNADKNHYSKLYATL